MDIFIEQVIIYSVVLLLCLVVVLIYLRLQRKATRQTEAKIDQAKKDGVFEPISLHPVIDLDTCIGSGACVAACPEEDVLGLRNGKATTINASHCVGHGACFHACPVEAITLCIGTEKRGVDLPHVKQDFETNVPGVYIAGELGGMGLIKNSVEQGKQAVQNIAKSLDNTGGNSQDLIIVGAGPAGISASLTAKKLGLNALILEQDTLGGTVFTFPRAKVVMTAPMELPGYGKIKLYDTSKQELLDLWQNALGQNNIEIREKCKVEKIDPLDDRFLIHTVGGDQFETKRVLIAIGRRGTPRKLGVPGEDSEKVAYRLLEPELIKGKNIIVVGGGDSAIESALLVAEQNNVILSYRREAFSRIKPKNRDKIQAAIAEGHIDVRYHTNVIQIDPETVTIKYSVSEETEKIPNDLIYIFAGGELPTKFLEKTGITITKKFGEAILSHKKSNS